MAFFHEQNIAYFVYLCFQVSSGAFQQTGRFTLHSYFNTIIAPVPALPLVTSHVYDGTSAIFRTNWYLISLK